MGWLKLVIEDLLTEIINDLVKDLRKAEDILRENIDISNCVGCEKVRILRDKLKEAHSSSLMALKVFNNHSWDKELKKK